MFQILIVQITNVEINMHMILSL